MFSEDYYSCCVGRKNMGYTIFHLGFRDCSLYLFCEVYEVYFSFCGEFQALTKNLQSALPLKREICRRSWINLSLLCHAPADAWRFFNQVHFEPSVCHAQGSLNSLSQHRLKLVPFSCILESLREGIRFCGLGNSLENRKRRQGALPRP